MRIFGIKPHRRRGRKYQKSKVKRTFPNLLLEVMPSYPNHIWAADFTEFVFQGRKVYLSTILDLYTRRLAGIHIAIRKGTPLTVETLGNALFHHPKPVIFHQEYPERMRHFHLPEQARVAPGKTDIKNHSMINLKWISVIQTDLKH